MPPMANPVKTKNSDGSQRGVDSELVEVATVPESNKSVVDRRKILYLPVREVVNPAMSDPNGRVTPMGIKAVPARVVLTPLARK